MAYSETSNTPSPRFERGTSTVDRLQDPSFPLAVRGYDRRSVDDFLAEVRALVADLESRQSREDVVQNALDEVGVQTAGILQRANATAAELTARSQTEADGIIRAAEREAEMLRRDADIYSEQVVVDTRRLWDQRQSLIEDIRALADEVLGLSDDAHRAGEDARAAGARGPGAGAGPLRRPVRRSDRAIGRGKRAAAGRLRPRRRPDRALPRRVRRGRGNR